MCESLVRSRGGCLHTCLGLSKKEILLRAWWTFSCCTIELKETQAGVLVLAGESKKEGVRGLGACT